LNASSTTWGSTCTAAILRRVCACRGGGEGAFSQPRNQSTAISLTVVDATADSCRMGTFKPVPPEQEFGLNGA
jgi:hypothetical protein